MLSYAGINIFLQEISNFCYIKKYEYRLHFDTEFLILLTLFNSLKVILIDMVATLKMPAKLATLGLLKIKVYWIKGCDVIISVYDVNKKILSHESSYNVDMVM